MKQKILEMLRSGDDYISGEQLSRELGVTRSAVWKYIRSLREEGYVIDSATNKGYHLEKCPDLLDADKLRKGRELYVAGNEIEVLRSIDSTNNELKRRAAQGVPGGLVVAADVQTAGKGRFGRAWSSSEDGIYFSLLLRPELPPGDIASVTLAAGYAVCLAIRRFTGLDARIKWPNDVIVGNKKICGILTEMSAQSDRIDYIIVGIGINANQQSFPEEISSKASSLYILSGKHYDKNDLLRAVIEELDSVMSSFLVSLSSDDADGFRELCATLGRRVSTQRGGELIEGEASDITASGELIVRCDDGHEYRINSGEVTVQGIY